MPRRNTIFVDGYYYHVYNRGLNRQITFPSRKYYSHALETINYYKNHKPPLRLSKFLVLKNEEKLHFLNELTKNNETEVEIHSYCLMPNHYHFILKQKRYSGVSKFISNFQNSYTKYFNSRYKIQGGIFIPRFKSVLIETDEQLVHVSRYIHLNPYSSHVVKTPEELAEYPYSSFREFQSKYTGIKISKTEEILSYFRSRNEYKKFILNYSDYQKKLKRIKHLLFDLK